MAADLNLILNGTPVPVYLGESTTLARQMANAAAASAVTAVNAKNAAQEAAGASEDARDVAQAAVGVDYADEAAALAGSSEGDRFTYWDGDEIVFAKKDEGAVVPITAPWYQSDKISHDGQNLSAYLNLLGTNFASYSIDDMVPGDLNAAIAAMKSDGYRYATLPTGTLIPTANLAFDNFVIDGRGSGVSTIDLSELTSGYGIRLNGRSRLIGAGIVGDLADFDVNTPFFTTIDEVVALTGMGSVHGVCLDGPLSFASDLEITGISGAALIAEINNVGATELGPMTGAARIRLKKNYAGIYLPSSPGAGIPSGYGAEYLTFADLTANSNRIGVIVQGGNNLLTNCHSDHNQAGVLLLDGHNNSHGSYTGGTINHSKFATMIARKIANGFNFTGLNIWDGGTNGIYIDRSRGVNFIGGIIEATKIQGRGGYGTTAGQLGINRFNGVAFVNQGSANMVRNIDAGSTDPDTGSAYGNDNLVLSNCHHMMGDVIRSGNVGLATRWDRAYINDEPIYGERRTLAGASNVDSIVCLEPLDAHKFINTGTGSLKIRLPFAFGNTMFRTRIKVTHRTTGRDLIDVDISAYLLSSGPAWNSVRYLSRGGYRPSARFGYETVGSSNYPIIYLDELATSWTDCAVRVVEVEVFSSALSQLQYVTSGWSISLESSAFAGLTSTETRLGDNTTGDVDTVLETCSLSCASSATNIPAAAAGRLTTWTPSLGATTGVQEYRTFAGAIYHRTRTASVWGSWESSPITLSGSAVINPGSIAVGDVLTTTVTVTGAALGDRAIAAANVALQGMVMFAEVTATNTVTVTYYNPPYASGAVDLANHTVKATVFK